MAASVEPERDLDLYFLLSLVGLVGVWWVLSWLFPLGIASPYRTALYIEGLVRDEFQTLVGTVFISMFRIVSALVVSLLFGTVLGVVMGMDEKRESLVYGGVLVGMMIPGLSWAIMTLVIFGLNELGIVVAVILATTPYLTVTVWEGVKAIDTDLLKMATVFEFSRGDTIRHVIVPQIVPFLFSATRYGLGLAWKIVVVVELLGASSGIGFKLSEAFSLFRLDAVFAWTFILVVIMIGIEYGLIRPVEHRVLSWRTREGYQWR